MQVKPFLRYFTYILLSLMVVIPSGSFFLSQHLSQLFESNTYTEDEIKYGLKMSLPAAMKIKHNEAVQGTSDWIYYTKKLAENNVNYAIELASYYRIEEYYQQSILWYKKAQNLNSVNASVQLAELYVSLGRLNDAKTILFPLQNEFDVINKLVQIAVIEGDIEFITENLSLLNTTDNRNLITQLSKFQVIDTNLLNTVLPSRVDLNKTSYMPRDQPVKCENSVQLVATNFANLEKLETLIAGVENHPLSSTFCFNTPRYIPITQLECETISNTPIVCNELMWADITPSIETRYIGLMVDQGGANVNQGILYIDKGDDGDVFTHELAHLVGFVDEYELPESHRICQSAQTEMFSHNIVVLPKFYEGSKKEVLTQVLQQIPWADNISTTTPIIYKMDNRWKLGTQLSSMSDNAQTVGLFPVDTCTSREFASFKPVHQVTQLNYYEEKFPDFYTQRIRDNSRLYSMPSYHYNIAKAWFNVGNDTKGINWLSHALNNEVKGSNRYNKVKRGYF
jgi:hypothetical protein